MAIPLYISVCLVVPIVLKGSLGDTSASKWMLSNSYGDVKSSVGNVFTLTTNSIIYCSSVCYQTSGCKWFGYGASMRVCQGYTGSIDDAVSGFEFQADTRLYYMYNKPCAVPGYIYSNSLDMCVKISMNNLTWYLARQSCQDDGANLIIVKDSDVLVYIDEVRLKTGQESFWVGGYMDLSNRQTWMWVNGEVMADVGSEKMWHPTEPNNLNEEGCLETEFRADTQHVKLNDLPCTLELPFVCSM